MNCQEITTGINNIKTMKAEFDDVVKTDIPKALDLKKELQASINQLKEILNPVFKIEGKEFPVFKLEICGKTGPELATELKNRGINPSGNSEFMFQSPEFVKAEASEKIPTVRLQVRALFSDESSHAYSEILSRANELGLGFLPHETAADLLLNERTQPKMGEWWRVVSNPIAGQDGRPSIFFLERSGDGLYLSSDWAKPGSKWNADDELMFSVRKL